MVMHVGRGNHYSDPMLYFGNGRGVSSSMEDGSQMSDSMTYTSNGRGAHHDPMTLYIGRGGYSGAGNSNCSNHKPKRNWHLICDYCKLHGHTKDICYKLIGYPANWKFKKKGGPGVEVMNTGRGIANHAYADGDGFGHMDAGYGLMYSGLGLGTTDGSGSSRASNDPLQTRQGGLDSMDNMNMANTNTEEKYIYLMAIYTTSVTHVGKCKLTTGETLNNVLVVPDFKTSSMER
ncbi:hypothetical protein KY290_031282 [Solanum tuberosum]|uniref:Integrase core domain containing protein n=1 Tax=Solanum tuberosum TaxID=4113 RepID=A0ABQ7U8P7_SOLTU|nr:hypothetical protein KY290_031282 [Solanum tuberosum]